MKKILSSLGVIAVVAVLAVNATGAFFSDTETSTGNTFTAGAIDLKIDSTQHYNEMICVVDPSSGLSTWQPRPTYGPITTDYPVAGTPCGGTWALKDLNPTSDKFFNFSDIKPGDYGENTISLHVINNDAWVCAEVSGLTDNENGRTEPEALVDASDGVGELSQNMKWTIWKDDGDNIMNGTEVPLLSGHPVNGILALYDSTTVGGALLGSTTAYLGVKWEFPLLSGNETQTDSLTADISFNVVQARNNPDFVCNTCVPVNDELLFVDSFESGDFTNWTSMSGGWFVLPFWTHDGSPNLKHAFIRFDTGLEPDNLVKAISTVGHKNLVLSYWYRVGDQSIEASNHVLVQWSVDGTNWNTVVDHTNLPNTNGWRNNIIDLPVGAENNAGFQLRFSSDLHQWSSDDDMFKLDDITLRGDTLCYFQAVIR